MQQSSEVRRRGRRADVMGDDELGRVVFLEAFRPIGEQRALAASGFAGDDDRLLVVFGEGVDLVKVGLARDVHFGTHLLEGGVALPFLLQLGRLVLQREVTLELLLQFLEHIVCQFLKRG